MPNKFEKPAKIITSSEEQPKYVKKNVRIKESLKTGKDKELDTSEKRQKEIDRFGKKRRKKRLKK